MKEDYFHLKGDPRNVGSESVILDTSDLGKAPSSLATAPTGNFVLEASQHRQKHHKLIGEKLEEKNPGLHGRFYVCLG